MKYGRKHALLYSFQKGQNLCSTTRVPLWRYKLDPVLNTNNETIAGDLKLDIRGRVMHNNAVDNHKSDEYSSRIECTSVFKLGKEVEHLNIAQPQVHVGILPIPQLNPATQTKAFLNASAYFQVDTYMRVSWKYGSMFTNSDSQVYLEYFYPDDVVLFGLDKFKYGDGATILRHNLDVSGNLQSGDNEHDYSENMTNELFTEILWKKDQGNGSRAPSIAASSNIKNASHTLANLCLSASRSTRSVSSNNDFTVL